MSQQGPTLCRVAIACGGTGGHLFPGLAVAEKLIERGCTVTLLVSSREIDQVASKSATGVEIFALPAVGLKRGGEWAFVRGFTSSYRQAKALFRAHPPGRALAMGGFTSAAPILAARRLGARTFLHESNTVPGRANRWLSPVVHGAFVGFEAARKRLHTRNVFVTGTPVRPQFQPQDARGCRRAFGLDPERPVLLVMGGSQGASGINNLVRTAVPAIRAAVPECQWLHLSGQASQSDLQSFYAAQQVNAVVLGFCDQMHLALGAAALAISRAGASSLAELAAMQVPALLVPYPAATDNHQFSNAWAYQQTGAARLIEEKDATPETLLKALAAMLRDESVRTQMQTALASWHRASAAEEIAIAMLAGALPSQVTTDQRQLQAERRRDDTAALNVALREVS